MKTVKECYLCSLWICIVTKPRTNEQSGEQMVYASIVHDPYELKEDAVKSSCDYWHISEDSQEYKELLVDVHTIPDREIEPNTTHFLFANVS